MLGELFEATCPECGRNRVRWTLHRWTSEDGDRATRTPYVAWICRLCGATWAQPITPGIEPIIEVENDLNPD